MDGFFAGVLIVFLIAVFLPQTNASIREIDESIRLCEQNSGVKNVRPSGFIYSGKAYCENGAEFMLFKHDSAKP